MAGFPFLWPNNILLDLSTCLNKIWKFYLLVNGSLGCLHVWLLYKMLQCTWEYRYLFERVILFPSDTNPEVEWLDHMVFLFLIFWGDSVLFPIVATPVYILISSIQGLVLIFSTSIPALVISWIFDDFWCEVTSYYGFDLHFPDDQWCWVLFHIPFGCLYVSFGKCLFGSSTHF